MSDLLDRGLPGAEVRAATAREGVALVPVWWWEQRIRTPKSRRNALPFPTAEVLLGRGRRAVAPLVRGASRSINDRELACTHTSALMLLTVPSERLSIGLLLVATLPLSHTLAYIVKVFVFHEA